MAFLHEKIDVLRENGYAAEMPEFIPANLNPAFELRPYQITAFENFITHFESPKCPHPTQVFSQFTNLTIAIMNITFLFFLFKVI